LTNRQRRRKEKPKLPQRTKVGGEQPKTNRSQRKTSIWVVYSTDHALESLGKYVLLFRYQTRLFASKRPLNAKVQIPETQLTAMT